MQGMAKKKKKEPKRDLGGRKYLLVVRSLIEERTQFKETDLR